MSTHPIPAKGRFPYPHRTVAEVNADRLAKALAEFSPPPSDRLWCGQCDRSIHLRAVACCKRRFCPHRKARAA